MQLKHDICLSQDAICKRAAHEIAALLRAKPDAVIGMATGGTPEPMYAELVRMHKEEGLDFSKATFFNLDEYVGLPHDHPQSYHAYMHKHLYSHVNADPCKINILNGLAEDKDHECRAFEAKIKDAGGIDLQILGIGENGHIGFCEPGTPFDSKTHCVTLTDSTRKANARYFDDDINKVPTHALTMGLDTIMQAKRVILLANGEKKAQAIGKALNEPKTDRLPASILQDHPNATFMVDNAAARDIQAKIQVREAAR